MEDINKAIAYFDDAVKETDEIIANCSDDLKQELTEQGMHFVVAIKILAAWVGLQGEINEIYGLLCAARIETDDVGKIAQIDNQMRCYAAIKNFMRDVDAIPLEVPDES